jgi:hypothetical protein
MGEHPDHDPAELFVKALESAPELTQLRENYLKAIALDESKPAMVRFYLLRILFNRAEHAGKTTINYRNQLREGLLSVASKGENLLPSEMQIFWPAMDALLGASTVHFYACSSYNRIPASSKEIRASHPGYADNQWSSPIVDDFAAHIINAYSQYPECYQASLDAIDPMFGQMCRQGLHGFAEVSVLSCLKLWMPFNSGPPESGTEMSYLLANIHNAPRFDIKKQGLNKIDPSLFQIIDRFPLFASVFGENGLKRLRSCSPGILSPLKSNEWVEERTLKSYCPIDTW